MTKNKSRHLRINQPGISYIKPKETVRKREIKDGLAEEIASIYEMSSTGLLEKEIFDNIIDDRKQTKERTCDSLLLYSNTHISNANVKK